MRHLAMTGRRARRAAAALAGIGAVALGLVACGDAGFLTPPPSGTAAPTEGASAPEAEPTPGESAGGTPTTAPEDAELAAFRAALEGQTVGDPAGLVAAIEAAGFDRAAIERTRELDSLGAPVTFVEVAVRLGDSCLVGQVGDGEPMAVRTGLLGGERCLIGSLAAP